MTLLHRLIGTDHRLTPLILRLSLGLVIFPHGAQKLFGWFGGYGYTATVGAFETMFGLPPAVTTLVLVAEFFGGLALILGVASRLAAIGVAAVMVGAVIQVNGQHGFFMNWLGTQQGEGFEYHLLAIGLAAAVAILGSGAFSIDRMIAVRSIHQ